ncbi:MAG: DNA polymerase Y family protein [Sneathiella sp.]
MERRQPHRIPSQKLRSEQKASPSNLSADDPPFALVTHLANAIRLTATNATAEKEGVHIGLSLTDARALYPALETAVATPEEDQEALENLTFWCLRFTPLVTLHPPDGLALDITGCAHLFGGEKSMMRSLSGALSSFGLSHHLALADTIGAAWAVARHAEKPFTLVPTTENAGAIAPLPLAALRLEPDTVQQLRQLGLRKIGHLMGAPKAPLTSRFGPALLRRLRQATGEEAEVFNPLCIPPAYSVRYPFEEPVLHISALEAALTILTSTLEKHLKEALKGARELSLHIFRVDGHVERLFVRTSRLCQEADHMTLLFQENLANFHDDLDTGFGIDLMLLTAQHVEDMADEQKSLPQEHKSAAETSVINEIELGQLLDRFGNRFGFNQVTRFIPKERYIPEKSFQRVPITHKIKTPPWTETTKQIPPRPFLVFSPPEPITVLAEVPDGPPLRFQWRRLHHHIARAEGPERLAPEWWSVSEESSPPQTRDYYRVENTAGHRFWLYREGLYDRDADTPQWYMQGLFP